MITQDHIEQELSRLDRCERFNDPTRRNWPWKEVWQEAMDRHRAFLHGKTIDSVIKKESNEDNLKMNKITCEFLKRGFKN